MYKRQAVFTLKYMVAPRLWKVIKYANQLSPTENVAEIIHLF